MMLKECNMIISYLFYNQTDINGACKNCVKLWKFIYEVLNLALCANLNKWYWSHSLSSFLPSQFPCHLCLQIHLEVVVCSEKEKVDLLTLSCVRISLSSWSPSRRRLRCSKSFSFCLVALPIFRSHSWIEQNLFSWQQMFCLWSNLVKWF